MADTSDDDSDPASPPPAVLRAIREQLTEELIQSARRYARRRARLVLREAGTRIDNLYNRELVQDAIGDTWRGAARWDPSRRTLLDHIRDVIKQRTFNDRRRARAQRERFVSTDAANDQVSQTIVATLVQPRATVEPQADSIASMLEQVVSELHRLASRDSHARAILGCWGRAIADASDVMELTGLSPREYDRARERILYLVRHLPPELRDAAEELLRSVS